jgi:hypothetical protein
VLLRQTPNCTIFLDDFEEGGIQLLLCSANFEVILARYTRIPKTTGNESEHTKKQATNDMEKGNVCLTHPQGPLTTWRCSRAATSPPRRPLEASW